jgi:hypothetical protein
MRGKVYTDKACEHQFVEEQSGLNKTAVPHLDENSRALDFFMLFVKLVFPTILEQTNYLLHQNLAAQDRPSASTMQDVKNVGTLITSWFLLSGCVMTGKIILGITGLGINNRPLPFFLNGM